VRFWVERPDFIASSTELAKIIKSKFDENGIEIPFSQLDLHIVDSPKEGIRLAGKES
jgi:small conductance mechanosensitive channel